MTNSTEKAAASAARMRKSRAKREAQGLERVDVWAYPQDKAAIKAYAERKRKEREG